jgi:hypothetical protein
MSDFLAILLLLSATFMPWAAAAPEPAPPPEAPEATPPDRNPPDGNASAAPVDPVTKLKQQLAAREAVEVRREQQAERLFALRERAVMKIAWNEMWRDKAVEKERDLVEKARKYDDKGDYAKARTWYRKALRVAYAQWIVKSDASLDSLKASKGPFEFEKVVVPLFTPSTRRAYERLMSIDTDILRRRILAGVERASALLERNDLTEAYRLYQSLEAASAGLPRCGDTDDLRRYIGENMADILATVAAPLEAAERAIDAEDYARAADALDRFEAAYDTFEIHEAIFERQRRLNAHAGVRAERRRRRAARRLELAKAALERKDYANALERLDSTSQRYPDTPAGQAASRLKATIEDDPKVAEAVQEHTRDQECRILLSRAAFHQKLAEYDEAFKAYVEILRKYPNTTWAEQALKRGRELEARLNAAPKP